MTTKVYKFLGIDTAMHLLRPGAKWEIFNNNQFICSNQHDNKSL